MKKSIQRVLFILRHSHLLFLSFVPEQAPCLFVGFIRCLILPCCKRLSLDINKRQPFPGRRGRTENSWKVTLDESGRRRRKRFDSLALLSLPSTLDWCLLRVKDTGDGKRKWRYRQGQWERECIVPPASFFHSGNDIVSKYRKIKKRNSSLSYLPCP